MTSNCLPFVASAHVTGNFRRIEGGGGYWGKMPDVFDPKYAEAAEKSIAPVARKFATNRFCIGFSLIMSWLGMLLKKEHSLVRRASPAE